MKKRFTTCLVLTLILCGCGLTQKQAVKIQAFGTAAGQIGSLGELEFISIRNSIIEMNTELVSIDSTLKAGSLVLDEPVSAVSAAERVAACSALKLYGELLVQLATEDREENIRKTADELLTRSAAVLKKNMTDKQKGAISSVIAEAGSFWIQKKKADAAREIITAYSEPVDAIAGLLLQDFSLEDGSTGCLKSYETTAKSLKNAAMILINTGTGHSPEERDRAVQAFSLAQTHLIRAKELGGRAQSAIQGLKKANVELVNVIGNRELSTDDIKECGEKIQELVTMYRVLAE